MRTFPPVLTKAIAEFERRCGQPPTHYAVAPGRVNLIGEHTDYQGGFVFPAAIDKYVAVAARVAPEMSVVSSSVEPEPAVFFASNPKKDGIPAWSRYVSGMAWSMGPGRVDIQGHVESDLPVGAGLSSSAAMEMAFGCLWREMEGLLISNPALALAGQRAENEFVGVQCGIMDQTASLFGVAGHALLIDTENPVAPTPIPLPDDVALVVCDTRVKHSLGASAYNERRAEAESAARKLMVPSLRRATLLQVESSQAMNEKEQMRARHIVTENSRVESFVQALKAKDRDAIRHWMRASHQSLRTQFEVSCFELDAMVDAAQQSVGCWGVRMTGGGFGGSCIALVDRDKISGFVKQTEAAYFSATARNPLFHSVSAADGAYAAAL